jgi:hypothetical protein
MDSDEKDLKTCIVDDLKERARRNQRWNCTCGAHHSSNPNYHQDYCDLYKKPTHDEDDRSVDDYF